MEDVDILEKLFDSKKLDLLRFFIANENEQFYLREIAKRTNLPASTTFRLLNMLVELKVLKLIEFKNSKLYQLEDNKSTGFLKNMLKLKPRILDAFVDKVKTFEGLESVVLHGTETKDRANILLIGEDIDPNEIKRMCAEIKENFGFNITSLTLGPEQFQQMSAMGLYSGKKKVLWKRV